MSRNRVAYWDKANSWFGRAVVARSPWDKFSCLRIWYCSAKLVDFPTERWVFVSPHRIWIQISWCTINTLPSITHSPNRIWIFTFTRTVLRHQISGWQHTSVIFPLNLRFGSGNASQAIPGHCRVCQKMWRTPGPMRFRNCCGSKPNGIEVSEYCDWFRYREEFFYMIILSL